MVADKLLGRNDRPVCCCAAELAAAMAVSGERHSATFETGRGVLFLCGHWYDKPAESVPEQRLNVKGQIPKVIAWLSRQKNQCKWRQKQRVLSTENW